MIYRLLVNAAFLAVGYYIGKEVGRLSGEEGGEVRIQPATEKPDETDPEPLDEDSD